MWKPDESLDDYMVRPSPEVTSEPPRSVSLGRTGEVEVLKPLTRTEVKTGFHAKQPIWFRRVLVAGSAALVAIALVLVSAILVGINDTAAGPDVATNENSDGTLTQPGELFTFDLSIPLTFLPATGETVRSNIRRRPVTQLVAGRSKPQLRAPLQAEEPVFVPTTLVIYAENGVITSRIEPWLQSSDR